MPRYVAYRVYIPLVVTAVEKRVQKTHLYAIQSEVNLARESCTSHLRHLFVRLLGGDSEKGFVSVLEIRELQHLRVTARRVRFPSAFEESEREKESRWILPSIAGVPLTLRKVP